MELERALMQIADIRRQIGVARDFRGFRAATTMATAGAAVGAGAWQSWRLPDAVERPREFVLLWMCVAVGCMGASGLEMWRRYRNAQLPSQRELTRGVVGQFLPFLAAGGLLAAVICGYAGEAMWMLPGLWQMIFGLGLCSLRRWLPGAIGVVGAFYILCGLINLSGGAARFSPWGMGLPFAVGQAASAIILYWKLERSHAA